MEMYTGLIEKMSRLQWLLHRQHMKTYSIAGPRADASRGQGRILAFLKMKDGISTKDLSYLLGIRVSSLNELLAKLEKAEYITREPLETDKRVMLIHLTDKGRQEEEPDDNDVFSCLSMEEQIAFAGYLDRIIAALEETLGTDDEREEMHDWMERARGRMGEAQFEELMAMRGGPHGHGRHGRGKGRSDCERGCHGAAPEHMHGDRRKGRPHDHRKDEEE